MNSLAADLLWKFGKKHRKLVTALPNTIDNKEYSNMVGMWPKHIPRISASLEQILLNRPDMAILANFNSVVLKGSLSKLSVPYLLLDGFSGFDDYLANVEKISSAVNAKKEGKRFIQKFNTRLNLIKDKARVFNKKLTQKMTCLSYLYGSFAGSNTSFDDIVKAVGLINTAAAKGIRGFKQGSLEEIIFWDPDLMVIGCSIEDCRKSENIFRKRYIQLKTTRAYKNDLIVAISMPLLTSVQESMLDAAEILQKRMSKPSNSHLTVTRSSNENY